MYRQTNCLIVHHFLWVKRLTSQTLYKQHYVLISLNGKEINKYQYQYQFEVIRRQGFALN